MERVRIAEFATPFGGMLCASTEAGLAYVRLPRASGRGFAGWLRRHAPGAEVEEAWKPNRPAVQQILEFLDGKRDRFDLPLDLRGTDFQRRVWKALLRIPYGQTRTYAQIARSVGRPAAVRAVGAANGANPVALVVPCHRVVATGGKLGGYAGGLPLKARLLALEGAAQPAEGRLL